MRKNLAIFGFWKCHTSMLNGVWTGLPAATIMQHVRIQHNSN